MGGTGSDSFQMSTGNTTQTFLINLSKSSFIILPEMHFGNREEVNACPSTAILQDQIPMYNYEKM